MKERSPNETEPENSYKSIRMESDRIFMLMRPTNLTKAEKERTSRQMDELAGRVI
jgi:hypothetical protein